jgi:hypothetical protein
LEGKCKLVLRIKGFKFSKDCKHLKGQYRDSTKKKQ